MIYTDASTMRLTRNCLALATSTAAVPTGLLQTKVTYINGCYSIVDLATGEIIHYSRYRKHRTHNRVNDNPKAYKITPVYFTNLDATEPLYRHGKVHILNAALSAYHRDLYESALQRAAIQDDYAEIRVPTHHIDGNKHNNSIYNLLPVTEMEHIKIHQALKNGASTYESLIAGLGEDLVIDIFGSDYFNFGDCSVYTASIKGTPYTQHMLTQLSAANLPAGTSCLRVRLLNRKYDSIDIAGLSIYGILSALYTQRAVEIVL